MDLEEELPTEADVESALGTESDDLGLSEEQRAIVAKILPKLTAKVTVLVEAKKAKELESFVAKMTTDNQKMITEKVEEIRKLLTPPSPDELQILLNQEYTEFSLKLRDTAGTRDFTIRELSVDIETRIIKILQKTIGERLTEIGQVEWSGGVTMVDKLQCVIAMVPGALETVSDCVAICLDPDAEHPEITGAWVRKHIGVQRLLTIVHAQVSVSRYRDFLSLASRFFPGMMTQ